jgi:hypothetical protein
MLFCDLAIISLHDVNNAKFEVSTAPLLDIKTLLRWQTVSLAEEFPMTYHPKDEGSGILHVVNDSPRHYLCLQGQGRESLNNTASHPAIIH